MPFLPDDLSTLIAGSQNLTSDQRLQMFEMLAEHVSLIPIRGGFPQEGEGSKGYKAAIETGWQNWCVARRPFKKNDFSPERAGITCGPASGLLVLDIDDWNKFDAWLTAHGLTIGELKNEFIVSSQVGRGHIYYKYPNDGNEYRNRANPQNGFDVRGLGGYVLSPGSLHPETKEIYKITRNGELTPPPEWLRNYILNKEDYGVKEVKKESIVIDDKFIDGLPISNEQKFNILNKDPIPDRSSKSMEVMISLLANGVSDDLIKKIYEIYPIGEKAREKNKEWFIRELNSAKDYIVKNNIKTLQINQLSSAGKHKITVYNALDVVTSKIDFEFMIDNVWAKGEPLLITGIGGAGKSLMTLQLAMDLVNPPANGFLNRYKVNTQSDKHRILFIQSENSLAGMKKRFSTIRDPNSGYKIDDAILKESIFFAGMSNDITAIGNFEDNIFLNELSQKIEEVKADIIVVDPLISFHQKDENSNDQMRKVLDILAEFCRSMKVTPLLVHHHGKIASETGQGGGRGASAIGDWSPNTWELSKGKDGYTFSSKKTRNFATPDDIKLELHYLRFRPLGGTGIDDNLLLVIQALKDNNGKFDKQKDFAAAMAKILENQKKVVPVENTLINYIKSAVKKGLVTEKKKGKSSSYEINNEAVKKLMKK